MYLTFQLRK